MMLTEDELIVQAAGVVSKALYFSAGMTNDVSMAWINRQGRAARIARYRQHHDIPDSTPDDVIVQVITEDWDLG